MKKQIGQGAPPADASKKSTAAATGVGMTTLAHAAIKHGSAKKAAAVIA
jgi:hypothetical protein